MHQLEDILRTNEDWLMTRILEYAKEHDYTKYTSTILEAWRLSISGLTEAVSKSLESWPILPALGPDEDYSMDPTSEFGINEAQKHRERGVSFSMFMGLFKFYRLTFHNLIDSQNIPPKKNREYHSYLERCFDRIEIAFAASWVEQEEAKKLLELQSKNRLLVNEKNMFRTLLESVEHPVLCVDKHLSCFFANLAFAKLVPTGFAEHSLYNGMDMTDSKEDVHILKDVPWATDMIRSFLQSNDQRTSRSFTIKSNQSTEHYDIVFSRLNDFTGKLEGCVMVMNNVTTLKEAYIKVSESEEKVQSILESSPLPLVITDAETGITLYVNKRMELFFGASSEDLVGIKASTLYANPEDRQEMIDLLLAEGEAIGLERHIKNFKGEYYWVLMSAVSIIYGSTPAYLTMTQDITQEKLVREERHKLFLAVDGSPSSVIITDADGNIEYVNRKLCDITGYSKHEIMGKNPRFLKSGIQGPDVYQNLWATISAGKEWRGELCNINKNNQLYWESVSISPIKNPSGTITNYIALKEDITERRMAEKALADSEKRFRTLTQKLPAGVLVFNPDASLTLFNDMACTLLGVNPADMKGNPLDIPLWEFVDHTGRPVAMKDYPVMRILAGEHKLSGLELGVTKSDGNITWLQVDAFKENNEAGELEYVVIHFWNITAYKKALDALAESRSRLEEAQRIAKIGSWILNLETENFVWSDEVFVLYETSPENFVPTLNNVLERVLPEYRNSMEKNLAATIERQDVYDTEYMITTLKGNQRFLSCKGEVVVQDGKTISIKGTVQDISDRKAAEQAIRENEQFQRMLLDSIGAGVIMVRPVSLIVESMNIHAEELIGPGAKNIIGQSVNELCWQSMDGFCSLGLPSMDDNQTEEFILLRPNGTRIPVTRTTVFVDVHGEPMYVLVVFDISDRKALERQLNLAQKLEAIGSLAAGIAHEINTPIQYISSNMTYLKRAFEEIHAQLKICHEKSCCSKISDTTNDDGSLGNTCDIRGTIDSTMAEIPEAIDDCQEGINRVSEIVMSMRNFSHPDKEDPTPVDINSAIHNTITISRNEWKYVAEVEMNLAEDLPSVRFSPGDCNQVLLNVIVNAAQAIGDVVEGTDEKGLITISTSLDDTFVEVRIKDTGGGIPESIQEKIFDPFFTTKEVGRGTGQGLAITHSILKRHSGWISFETEVGVGTEFILRLPIFPA